MFYEETLIKIQGTRYKKRETRNNCSIKLIIDYTMMKKNKKTIFSTFFLLAPCIVCLVIFSFFFSSCNTIDLYERNVAIPKQEWSTSFKPQFKFIIKDTTQPYQVYIILRHNDKYNYNNIWVNLY